MKCMIVADCGDKEKVMNVAFLSCVQKTKNGKTYLWYYTKSNAREDAEDLMAHGIKCEIKEGWENDGFVLFNYITTMEDKRELYDEVCRVLTWWEHPEEYPCGEDDFNRHISEEMYNVLVRVQNEMFDF